jgi:subtilisin family serine protease
MAISDKEQSDKGRSDGGRTFEEFYVEDQVLITGPVEKIDRVVETLASRLGEELHVELELAEGGETDLGQLLQDPAGDRHIVPCLEEFLPDLSACLEGQLGMRLYRIARLQTDDRPGLVEAVVTRINEEGRRDCVYSGPNWLTGYRYSAADGHYLTASSPYSAAGSPAWGPFGAGKLVDDFWNQWALKRIGLIQNGMRATARCGQGVRVGVFDTSPFKTEGRPVPAGWGHPPLLTVVHPKVFADFPVPSPPTIDITAPPDPPDLGSHGLSVAGLVYAVAPHSDIYLYRVLDEYARGNLYVLCCALIEFMEGVLSNPDAPNGGIINLSLGLTLPEGWQNEVGMESVFALDFVLALAYCMGLTVVAAAGNESTRQGPAEPAEFPASQPYVIGVMASNYDDDRSCFSNEGNITAPGGDGYDCGPGGEACMCPWEVEGIDLQQYGLVGPVLPNDKFPHGLAHWLGTSFATPLVSGMAALIREHHGGPHQAGVSGEILGHAKPGGPEIQGGIIDVQDY